MMGSGGHVSFNTNTIGLIDRIIVIRINTEEMQVETLLNATTYETIKLMGPEKDGKRSLSLSKLIKPRIIKADIKSVKEVDFHEYKKKIICLHAVKRLVDRFIF